MCSYGKVDEAKEELQEVVEFLRSPNKFRRLGGKLPKGMMCGLLFIKTFGRSPIPVFI